MHRLEQNSKYHLLQLLSRVTLAREHGLECGEGFFVGYCHGFRLNFAIDIAADCCSLPFSVVLSALFLLVSCVA